MYTRVFEIERTKLLFDQCINSTNNFLQFEFISIFILAYSCFECTYNIHEKIEKKKMKTHTHTKKLE